MATNAQTLRHNAISNTVDNIVTFNRETLENEWHFVFEGREGAAEVIRLLGKLGRTSRWTNAVENWAKAVENASSKAAFEREVLQGAVYVTYAAQ